MARRPQWILALDADEILEDRTVAERDRMLFNSPCYWWGFRLYDIGGWARPADRVAKHHRYLAQDPDGRYGWLAQYRSILDPDPYLVAWEE